MIRWRTAQISNEFGRQNRIFLSRIGEGSLKFGTFEDLIPGLVLRVRGYQRAWELYGGNEKRAKLAFKVHGGKMRTLQAKFNEFGKGLTREEKARIVVGYGDGMFPSHGYTWKTLNTPSRGPRSPATTARSDWWASRPTSRSILGLGRFV